MLLLRIALYSCYAEVEWLKIFVKRTIVLSDLYYLTDWLIAFLDEEVITWLIKNLPASMEPEGSLPGS
jgi:hypothetical protein